MTDEQSLPSAYPAAEKRQLAFNALSLEYGSLRSELTEKTTKNQQTTTLLVAAAGALYTLSSAQKEDWADPLLLVVAGALLLFAGVTWRASRRTVGKLSAHVAAVEQQIDELVDGATARQPYMNWETQHQNRSGLSGLGMGNVPKGRYNANGG